MIELKGNNSDESTLPLFFSALEKISVTEVKTRLLPNEWIRQKKKEHKIEDAPSHSFYSGAQMIRISIPKNSEFSITYSLTCTELKMLSAMHFNNFYETDSIKYHFKVPSIFQMKLPAAEQRGICLYCLTKTFLTAFLYVKSYTLSLFLAHLHILKLFVHLQTYLLYLQNTHLTKTHRPTTSFLPLDVS